MPRRCPNCGQSVKDSAKFCKYCGIKLGASVSAPISTPPAARIGPPPVAERKPVTKIPPEILAQLDIRAQLMTLEEEEKVFLKDLEALEEELEKGERSIAEIEKEIKPLQKQIKTLKTQEKKLQAKVMEFSFEKTGKGRQKWTALMDKLEQQKESGTVRESVYLRLQEEYKSSYEQADAEYQEQVILAREWLALLKAQYKAARDELALLDARHSVGEVKESTYKSRKLKLEKQSRILGHQVEIFETILRDF